MLLKSVFTRLSRDFFDFLPLERSNNYLFMTAVRRLSMDLWLKLPGGLSSTKSKNFGSGVSLVLPTRTSVGSTRRVEWHRPYDGKRHFRIL